MFLVLGQLELPKLLYFYLLNAAIIKEKGRFIYLDNQVFLLNYGITMFRNCIAQIFL